MIRNCLLPLLDQKPFTNVYRAEHCTTQCVAHVQHKYKATKHVKTYAGPNWDHCNFFNEKIDICQLGQKVWIRSGLGNKYCATPFSIDNPTPITANCISSMLIFHHQFLISKYFHLNNTSSLYYSYYPYNLSNSDIITLKNQQTVKFVSPCQVMPTSCNFNCIFSYMFLIFELRSCDSMLRSFFKNVSFPRSNLAFYDYYGLYRSECNCG